MPESREFGMHFIDVHFILTMLLKVVKWSVICCFSEKKRKLTLYDSRDPPTPGISETAPLDGEKSPARSSSSSELSFTGKIVRGMRERREQRVTVHTFRVTVHASRVT